MWPRRSPRHEHPEPDTQGIDEATEALEQAMSLWPEVRETAAHMRRLRERNHFAESIRHAFKGE